MSEPILLSCLCGATEAIRKSSSVLHLQKAEAGLSYRYGYENPACCACGGLLLEVPESEEVQVQA